MKKDFPRTGRAVFSARIGGTREDVYYELTRTDRALRTWPHARLHAAALEVDARIQLRTPSGGHTLADGVVVANDPPRRFAHTLCYTRFRDAAFVMSYELRELSSDVEVVLMLDELPLGTRTARCALRDARHVLADLKHVVEHGRLATMARVRHMWAGLTEFALPADTLAEHWPLEAARRARTTTIGG